MKTVVNAFGTWAALLCVSGAAFASSHMDAPMITLDDPANTTDVYAFRSESEDGIVQYLTTALAVYPFEEPGIGPNNYRFDDDVLYEIHILLGDDIAAGRKTVSYQFEFRTEFQNENTIRQAFLGVIDGNAVDADGFFENQNLRQSYTVTRVDHRYDDEEVIGTGIVPPNNQGLLTPEYNRRDDGDRRARRGVKKESRLDAYTRQSIADLARGYRSFAAQRDDGFYADIQSIFDLDFTFSGRRKPFDSQGGFNLHTIVLNIPLAELDDADRAGVYATTSRRQERELSDDFLEEEDELDGNFVQIGRQGNPLFAEALVALRAKDLYNRTEPTEDEVQFSQFAENPEVSALLGVTPITPTIIRDIFIPDVIKVDLTTPAARLAGDEWFNRLSVFGGDTLVNANGEDVPGGWPNGRRFGDDVVDIALIALGVPTPENVAQTDFDGVVKNDITFNDVFPYAATPLNGRNHRHH